MQELQNLWNNDDDKKKCQRKNYTFVSNVSGTKSYWVVKCHEFKSTSFFHSHIKKNASNNISYG